jgi:hypothetical protein
MSPKSIDVGPQGNRVLHSQYSSSLTSHRPDEGVEYSFSCSKKRGAILSLPLPAQCTDTVAREDFARRIVRDIDVWLAFAQQRGLGINCEDIILVTGCHLAKSWATIAFQNRGDQVAFRYHVSGDSNVTWHFTPKGVPYNLGPSGQVRFVNFSCFNRPRKVMVELFRIRIYWRISVYSLEASVLSVIRDCYH